MISAQSETSTEHAQTVMVVEDEPIVAQDMIFMLQDAGYNTVGPFRSIKSALEGLSSNRPDFVLLDVNLTDGQVFPVADALYENGTPFAFCSAHFVKGECEQAYPGIDVIAKPFVASEVLGVVGSRARQPT